MPGQPVLLDLPGAVNAAGQFAQGEAIDVLPHAGAGMIFRRGDPAVMTTPVFDGEVSVGRHCQHQTRQPLLDGVVFVAQLVAGVQAQPGIGPCHIGEQQDSPP